MKLVSTIFSPASFNNNNKNNNVTNIQGTASVRHLLGEKEEGLQARRQQNHQYSHKIKLPVYQLNIYIYI